MVYPTPVRERSSRFVADRLGEVALLVQRLRVSVRYLIIDFWDETRRRRALDLVQLIADGPSAGSKAISGVVKSLKALLSLSREDARAIRVPLGVKLCELLDLLHENCR